MALSRPCPNLLLLPPATALQVRRAAVQTLPELVRSAVLTMEKQGASGPVDALNPQVLNQKGSIFLTRPTLGHYTLTREELDWRAGDLFGWMAAATLDVRIDHTFALQNAADAHRYIEGRETKGKVLILP